MKFYIATSLDNVAGHNALRDDLVCLGHEITYDWTSHGAVFGSGLRALQDVAISEARGVMDADVVIVLWPGGRGTHVELGMAIAAGRPVVFISDVADHHEATRETCAFYHHPLVRRASSTVWMPVIMSEIAASPRSDVPLCP